jgi:hypothetical protein
MTENVMWKPKEIDKSMEIDLIYESDLLAKRPGGLFFARPSLP